jgi:hypothetical protein
MLLEGVRSSHGDRLLAQAGVHSAHHFALPVKARELLIHPPVQSKVIVNFMILRTIHLLLHLSLKAMSS